MKKTKTSHDKLWGNAFTESPEKLMMEFTSSHDVYPINPADSVLIPYDIKQNIAQVKMLYKQKILNKKEHNNLLEGLNQLYGLWEKGEFVLDPMLEDVHTNIENWLSKKYGIDVGGKIHTGRSRNDQVVTDMYLYLHDQIQYTIKSIQLLNKSLYKSAKKYQDTICPGYTHHQHAVVTSLGLILHSFNISFKRDIKGLQDLAQKYNYSPLGSGVGYGTLINIDPTFSAKELGFERKFKNPIDVISNRGEFEAALAFQICQFLNHASSLAQTFILFSTTEFGFLKLADHYSTGSSAMPQKKNPDALELIKSTASVANSNVSALMQITKGNLIGYNRDTQETKHIVYHLLSKVELIPKILSGIIETITVFPKVLENQANKGFINSLGLMEMIINETGLPMRKAKILIELSIKKSVENGFSDKVDFISFKEAQQLSGIICDISEESFYVWQDAN